MKHQHPSRIAVALAVSLLGAGCGPSVEHMRQLASAGQIDASAPITSTRTIVAAASPDKVWHVLTEIGKWPTWQPAITHVQVSGPTEAGTRFLWNNGDTRIASAIALTRRSRLLAWTGQASGLTAIHVWTLTPMDHQRTLVSVRESMSGFPSSLFYSSAELNAANGRWLRHLKLAAESLK